MRFTNCEFIFSQKLEIEVIASLTSLIHMELDIFWISINLDFVTETYVKLLDLFHQVSKSLYSDRWTWTLRKVQLISSHMLIHPAGRISISDCILYLRSNLIGFHSCGLLEFFQFTWMDLIFTDIPTGTMCFIGNLRISEAPLCKLEKFQ